MSEEPLFKILVTAIDGRTFFWHKQGKIQLLPESLAVTWLKKFKPDLFDILPTGEMVGSGRDPAALKIAKVERVSEAS